ncbi:hypothetical protein L6452_21266 [Arctium lappa]|uniref:Uncharacterized protein n=1 Tax=Arctium lappa TaxID=4217 RepID=A0ACB9BDR6_ARCLA|nr:hypothetical protein L6452_21266 [Arctium lappa]
MIQERISTWASPFPSIAARWHFHTQKNSYSTFLVLLDSSPTFSLSFKSSRFQVLFLVGEKIDFSSLYVIMKIILI